MICTRIIFFNGVSLSEKTSKGPRKNKFTILGIEAPGWQGAKVQEYPVYSELSQHSQTGWIGG
jgi:hypothetical protein